MEYAAFEFGLAHSFLFAGFALSEAFADAEDHLQTVGESEVNFLLQDSGSFVVVFATFAVTEDHVFGTGRFHHFSRNFTGVGTRNFVSAVFCRHGHEAVIYYFAYLSEVDEGRTDDHFAVGLLRFEEIIDFSSERNAFLEVLVHLPVTGNDVLSHD